jgi:2-polyprenyl-3-methyl-5-hydroxy-6-metoxy-1,4-benzoquinol methylase
MKNDNSVTGREGQLQQMTSEEFWETYHAIPESKLVMPSSRSVFNLDFQRLLRKWIRPGMNVLEIGAAPGRQLAWVAKTLRANVAGVDSSVEGMELAGKLFTKYHLQADLRCEDVFSTSFPSSYFDLVYSTGVIEHWQDPRGIVEKHIDLVAPGGVVLITIPNYSGINAWIEKQFYPEFQETHQCGIMSKSGLLSVVPERARDAARVYPYGRVGAWLFSFHRKWPRWMLYSIGGALNLVGMMQPVTLAGLNTMWVLELRRL